MFNINLSRIKKYKFSIVVITHNRLEYTRKTIESIIKNTTNTYELIVVDNDSMWATKKYLKQQKEKGLIQKLFLNEENMYPGKACNIGWENSSESEFLIRSDNDIVFNSGWDTKVLNAFKNLSKHNIGQLGLVNELFQVYPSYHYQYDHLKFTENNETYYNPLNQLGNVGGPCVIPSYIFKELGIHYENDLWDTNINEDFKFSNKIRSLGYLIFELPLGVVTHIGYGDFKKYRKYYKETYTRRGVIDWYEYRLDLEKKGKIKNGSTID